MKFTIKEFEKYLESQDSLGDIFYFLTEENVIKANEIDDSLDTDDVDEE